VSACKSEDLSMAGMNMPNFIEAFEAKGEMDHSLIRTFDFRSLVATKTPQGV